MDTDEVELADDEATTKTDPSEEEADVFDASEWIRNNIKLSASTDLPVR